MLSRDEVNNHLRHMLVETFEVDPGDITPDARLYEDLDIDSIDAADMMVSFREYTGRPVDPAVFKSARTVEDVVDAVCAALQE